MKLLKEQFIAKIDKVQIKQINDNCSIRLSHIKGNYNYKHSCRLSPKTDKSYNHYFFYCPDYLLSKIEKFTSKIDSAKIYISSPTEIAKSQGKLFKYNVKELYLNNGMIISL